MYTAFTLRRLADKSPPADENGDEFGDTDTLMSDRPGAADTSRIEEGG